MKSSNEAISSESASLERINSIARRKNAQEDSEAVKEAREALDDLKKLIDNIDSNSEEIKNILSSIKDLTDGMAFLNKKGRTSCYSMSFDVSYIEN